MEKYRSNGVSYKQRKFSAASKKPTHILVSSSLFQNQN